MTLPANPQGGQRLRLRGQEMSRPGGGNGDLYVKLTMVVPPQLTTDERERFTPLAAKSPFTPRDCMTGGRP